MRLVVFGWGNDVARRRRARADLLRRPGARGLPDVVAIEDYPVADRACARSRRRGWRAVHRRRPRYAGALHVSAKSPPARHDAHDPRARARSRARRLRAIAPHPPAAVVRAMRARREFRTGRGLGDEGAARLEMAWGFSGNYARALGRGVAAKAGASGARKIPNPPGLFPNPWGTKSKPGGNKFQIRRNEIQISLSLFLKDLRRNSGFFRVPRG